MSRLEWRNVEAPGMGQAGQLLAQSGANLSNSLKGLGSSISGFKDVQRRDRSTAQLMKLAGASNEAEFSEMLSGMSGQINPQDIDARLMEAIQGGRDKVIGHDQGRADVRFKNAQTGLTGANTDLAYANVGLTNANTGLVGQRTVNARDDNSRVNEIHRRGINQEDDRFTASGMLANAALSPATIPGVNTGEGRANRNWSRFAIGGAKRPDSFNAMTPGMQDGLYEMLEAAEAELGGKLQVYSGYRSEELQNQLFQDALKKYGSTSAARKWVAPPGLSRHNSGQAADLKFNGVRLDQASPEVQNWVRENAKRFGLAVPMSWEPWQVEEAGARSGDIPSTVGPTREAAAIQASGMPQNRRSQGVGTPERGTVNAGVNDLLAAIANGELDISPDQLLDLIGKGDSINDRATTNRNTAVTNQADEFTAGIMASLDPANRRESGVGMIGQLGMSQADQRAYTAALDARLEGSIAPSSDEIRRSVLAGGIQPAEEVRRSILMDGIAPGREDIIPSFQREAYAASYAAQREAIGDGTLAPTSVPSTGDVDAIFRQAQGQNDIGMADPQMRVIQQIDAATRPNQTGTIPIDGNAGVAGSEGGDGASGGGNQRQTVRQIWDSYNESVDRGSIGNDGGLQSYGEFYDTIRQSAQKTGIPEDIVAQIAIQYAQRPSTFGNLPGVSDQFIDQEMLDNLLSPYMKGNEDQLLSLREQGFQGRARGENLTSLESQYQQVNRELAYAAERGLESKGLENEQRALEQQIDDLTNQAARSADINTRDQNAAEARERAMNELSASLGSEAAPADLAIQQQIERDTQFQTSDVRNRFTERDGRDFFNSGPRTVRDVVGNSPTAVELRAEEILRQEAEPGEQTRSSNIPGMEQLSPANQRQVEAMLDQIDNMIRLSMITPEQAEERLMQIEQTFGVDLSSQ